jgi:protein disulfide-isomerase A1
MEYTGGRTQDTIVDWISKKTGPPSNEVDCAAMEAATAEGKLALSYFGALEGDLYDNFMKGARNPAIAEKFAFYHTSDAECASKYGASAPGVALSRAFDESPLAFAGANEDELVTFAKNASVPVLITFSEDYIEPIFGDQKAAVILFTEETGEAYQEQFAAAAKAQQGEILFVTSGVTDGIQSRLGEFIGVTKDDLPTLRIISPGEAMLKFVYSGDAKALTTADVASFVSDFTAGNLKPHLKSADRPEADSVEGLTTLVGSSWDEIVMDANKDVLVKYYAPWCGHCKSLAPIWAELAKETEGIEDLVIAKFDATENEVAGLEIRGYPTLKFYPKGDKSGQDYSGDRDLPAFKVWLAENSSAYKAANPEGAAQVEL